MINLMIICFGSFLVGLAITELIDKKIIHKLEKEIWSAQVSRDPERIIRCSEKKNFWVLMYWIIFSIFGFSFLATSAAIGYKYIKFIAEL